MNVAAILKAKGRLVTTARAEDSIEDVARKIAAKRIGALVVVNEAGAVQGIVSERDIVRGIGEKGIDILRRPVSDLMTKNVVTCSEQHSLDEMMGVMTQGRFRHVPVVVDGKLAGIISIGDVVKHHIAAVQLEVTAMREYLATG
ncbi:MAG: CBS domain-containing protein [Hyphomicrobiaceae bacterium]|nr:CBS domain-containing protein [Hyphomicrobiaceae bacterium]